MWYARLILTGFLIWHMLNEILILAKDQHGKYVGNVAKAIGACLGIFGKYITIFILLYLGGYYF